MQLQASTPSPTTNNSGMGNRSSAQSEEEEIEKLRPSKSYSGDVTQSLVEHNGEDLEDEVEVPPPMQPISEQLLTSTCAINEEVKTKRVSNNLLFGS